MNLNNNKEYLPFYALLGLFILIAGYTLFIYLKWDEQPEKINQEVEVSLPVIEWEKYTNLSKQYENDKLTDVKKN